MHGSAHRVVIVGGGFAGLQAVRGLRRAPVEVTLVDRQNYSLFQPLVYQVRTLQLRIPVDDRLPCPEAIAVVARPDREHLVQQRLRHHVSGVQLRRPARQRVT